MLSEMDCIQSFFPFINKARPLDYAPEYLDPQLPVSFHKHWMIDPVKVYSKWFAEVDQQMEADSLAQKHMELWNKYFQQGQVIYANTSVIL